MNDNKKWLKDWTNYDRMIIETNEIPIHTEGSYRT